MVKNARAVLLAALLGAAVQAAAQTGRMDPADNEASAMGNCFDRRLGVSRSAMDAPVGSGRPPPGADSGNSAASSQPPDSGNADADAKAPSATAHNSASPSSLPDCN